MAARRFRSGHRSPPRRHPDQTRLCRGALHPGHGLKAAGQTAGSCGFPQEKRFVCNLISPAHIPRSPRILRQLGDTEGAAREIRLGAQISADKTNLQAATFDTNSGMRLLKVGDLEGAISQFRAAIALAPGYAPAHFHLAEALRRKGAAAEAGQEFQRAAELDPQLKP